MKLLKLIFALFPLAINMCNADSFARIGVGVGNSGVGSISETKIISFGWHDKLFGPFFQQIEGGAWFDSRDDLGRKSSAFGGYSLGMHVQTVTGVYASYSVGPAVISHTDALLGGNFQFNNDFGFGISDESGYKIGLNYKHLSSAGIFKPNYGRDFLMLKLSIPW